jgi:hypothetical protein
MVSAVFDIFSRHPWHCERVMAPMPISAVLSLRYQLDKVILLRPFAPRHFSPCSNLVIFAPFVLAKFPCHIASSQIASSQIRPVHEGAPDA